MALVESAGAAYTPATNSTQAVTSGSFTPTAGSLLVLVAGIGNGGGITTTGVTFTGTGFFSAVTWTPLKTQFSGTGGNAGVWCLDAGASPTAGTVTATCAPTTAHGIGIVIRQFAGAAAAASQNGVTAGVTGSGLATIGITPLTTGSQVVGGFGDGQTNVAVVANAATTIYGQGTDGTGGSTFATFEATAQSVANTAQTLGFTVAYSLNAFALAEIIPGGAGGVILDRVVVSTTRVAVKRAALW
jgi:hypothetical protein